MQRWMFRSCLISCCLFFYSPLFAQDPSAPQQDIAAGAAAANAGAAPSGSGGASGSPGSSATAPTTAPATSYTFPSSDKMNSYWLRSMIGPKALIGGAFTASWKTWVSTSPDEWNKDADGWSQRFGAAVLDNGINTSVLVLSSRAMHQDPMYYRCDCTGAWARTRHAIEMTYMSRNRNGGLVFAPPKLVSPFTGPLVTRNTIYPDRFNSGDAASGGVYYLVGNVAWNMFREFVWNLGHK